MDANQDIYMRGRDVHTHAHTLARIHTHSRAHTQTGYKEVTAHTVRTSLAAPRTCVCTAAILL